MRAIRASVIGIREVLESRKPKERKESAQKPVDNDRRFNEKMKILVEEYAVDMNNSNDVEYLNVLVRSQIQLENADRMIDEIQNQPSITKDDTMTLKNLGDFRRNTANTINDIQDKLGISRKQRKEKATDDIPQWIESVLSKAQTFYDRKTIKVECPKDQVELARLWLNFPGEKNVIDASFTCWKCKEEVIYSG